MAIPFNDKRNIMQMADDLKKSRPYTTGGAKKEKPKSKVKVKPKKDGISAKITLSF